MVNLRLILIPVALIGLALPCPAQTMEDYIALIDGCRTGDIEQVKAALVVGVDINTPDKSGMTPLMHALDAGQSVVAKHLVKQGADLTLRSPHDENLLTFAIRTTDPETVNYLIKVGVPVRNNGISPVRTALEWGDGDTLAVLEGNEIDLAHWQDDFENSLTLAARHNNLKAVELLLKLKADPNQADPDGNYPLAVACLHGHTDMASLLLSRGADPNAISKGALKITWKKRFPHTALIAAIRANEPQLVKMLLDAGADPSLMQNQAILHADLAGHREIYDILLAKGVKKPYPYQFMEIPELQADVEANEIRELEKEPIINVTPDWGLLSLMNQKATFSEKKTLFPPDCNFSVAIIATDKASEPVEILLTSELSSVDGIQIIERSEIAKLLEEKKLSGLLGHRPEQAALSGKLLGADCLIVLKSGEAVDEANVIATATGLMLSTIPTPANQAANIRSNIIRDALARLSREVMEASEEKTLISIPRITALEEIDSRLDLADSLSGALAFHLGALDNVYVLEREEMNRLALEKNLTRDLRDFYASGWLLDGHFTLSGKDALNIALRLRKERQGQEKTITASGSVSAPQELLADLTALIAAELNSTPPANWSPGDEAETYAEDAKSAFRANLWEVAQNNADAAWFLGKKDKEIQDIRIRSRVHRIRTARWLIIQHNRSNRDLDRGENLLDSRSPLLRKPKDSRELRAMQYLQLSNDLIDMYEMVPGSDNLSDFQLDLLMFYPEVLKAATTPLWFLDTISDKDMYSLQIEALSERLLSCTEKALTYCKEANHPYLYQTLLNGYAHHLPYWINDEERLYAEIHRRCEEASLMKAPYSKHSFFYALHGIMLRQMKTFGGKSGTSWQRLAQKMAVSDVDDERLLGLAMLRFHTEDYRAKLTYSERILNLIEKVLAEDRSPLGITQKYDPELNEKLTIQNTYTTFPEYGMGVWYPDAFWMPIGRTMHDYGIYRKYWRPSTQYPAQTPGVSDRRLLKDYQCMYINLFHTRMDGMLRNGSLACDTDEILIHLKDAPFTDLKALAEKAEKVHAKIQTEYKGNSYMEKSLYRFNSYVIEQIKSNMEKQKTKSIVSAETSNMIASQDTTPTNTAAHLEKLGTGRKFHVPQLHPDYPKWDKEKSKFNFIISGFVNEDRWLWLFDISRGFFKYDPAEDIIAETVLSPDNGLYFSNTRFFNEKWFAAFYDGFNSKKDQKIGLYNRKTQKWTFYKPERLQGIEKIIPLDEHIYYTFFVHPSPDGLSRPEIIKDSKTSKGIARINIKTGKEELLVSNRRTPPQSPIDGANVPVYLLDMVSATEIRSGTHVFNEVTETWSAATRDASQHGQNYPSETLKTKHFHFTNLSTHLYDPGTQSIKLHPYYSDKSKQKNRPPEIFLPLDLTGWKELKLQIDPSRYPDSIDRHSGSPIFRIISNSKALLIYNKFGFMCIPVEELEPHLNAAFNLNE